MVQQKSLVTGDKPEVVIDEANGDLRLMGWERAEVLVKVEGDLTLQQSDDQVVHLRCDGDAIVRIPFGANLTVSQAHGDTRIKSVNGRVQLGAMSGDLALRNVGAVALNNHSGDVSIKHVTGDLTVTTIGGDFSLHDARNIQIGNVAGDCSARGIQGNAMIGATSGDISLEGAQGNVSIDSAGGDTRVAAVQGNVTIGNTAGDLAVTGAQGNVTLGNTAGDASIQGVQGQVNAGHISGDLTAQAVNGITAEVSGDATVTLLNPLGSSSIQASGDITARFAPDVNVNAHIVSEAARITVNARGGARVIEEKTYDLKLGSGEVVVALNAGGDVSVMCDAPATNAGRGAASQFDFDFNFDFEPDLGSLSGLGDRIAQHARAAAERATAGVQAKVERAARKAEEQARRAERRFGWSNRHARADEGWRPPSPPMPPQPPAPPREPVSDEERMMILRMLEQKKITAVQAEQLLSALTGKGA